MKGRTASTTVWSTVEVVGVVAAWAAARKRNRSLAEAVVSMVETSGSTRGMATDGATAAAVGRVAASGRVVPGASPHAVVATLAGRVAVAELAGTVARGARR